MRRFRRLLVASIAYTAMLAGIGAPSLGDAADYGADYGAGSYDFGPEFDDVHWTDVMSGNDDPMRADLDVDQEFEADDILALNLSRESQRIARKLGFRMQRKALKHLGLWLYRLRPPRGLASRAALATLRQADPKGFYDVNAIYGVAGAAVPQAASPGAAPKPTPSAVATTNTAPAPATAAPSASCIGVRCYGMAAIGWGACP